MIFAKENISPKPYGVVCYYLYFPFEGRSWFRSRSKLPIWSYSDTTYYETKKSQRMAYFDLSNKYTNHKFIAFSNNKGKHPVEIYGENFPLKNGYEL